jgi:hypothetical protein
MVKAKEKAVPKKGKEFLKRELWEGLVQALVLLTALSGKLDETKRASEELLGEVRAMREDLARANSRLPSSDDR